MTSTFGAANLKSVIPIGASSSNRVRGSKRTTIGCAETTIEDDAACGSAASRKDIGLAPFGGRALDMRAYAPNIGAYAHCQDRGSMSADTRLNPELCNCLALRQAARHVTQFYDQFLASAGLRTTQFSILARLRRLGPMTISTLAADLVMDRTTLGRNLQPLARERLVVVVKGRADRRSREIRLTETGVERLRAAVGGWAKAQAGFEAAFGEQRSSELRALLHAVSASDLVAASPPAS